MTVPLSAIRPTVIAEAMDCPNPVIDRALIDAARELCGAVPVWTDTVDLDIDGSGTFELQPPDGAEVDHPIGAPVHDGRAVCDYAYPDPRTLRIDRWPNEPGVVRVTLALRPSRTAASLPAVIAEDHEIALTAGALYRVLRMPGMTWSHPELGMYYGRLFRSRRANAIAIHNRGIGQGTVRAQPRRFAFFRRR